MTIYGTSAAFRNGLTGTEEWTRINNEVKARNGGYGHKARRSYEQDMRSSLGSNLNYDISKGLVSVNSIRAPDSEPNDTGWYKVINGGYDAAIRSYVRSIPSGHKCYLIYNHEPENDGGNPATLWRQAFARFAKVVLDCGNSNVVPTFNLMAYTWDTATRNPDDYNPARHMTAAEAAACVGTVDGYTRTPDELFTEPRADILSWGFRGFGVSEMASNSAAASPGWMLDLEDWVDTHTQVEYVCYWHAATDETYFLDQTETMLQTWADIIGRNQGANIPVSEIPDVDIPASSGTGNSTGTPVVGSGNTGGYGITVGAPAWTGPIRVSQFFQTNDEAWPQDDNSINPVVAAQADGSALVVWQQEYYTAPSYDSFFRLQAGRVYDNGTVTTATLYTSPVATTDGFIDGYPMGENVFYAYCERISGVDYVKMWLVGPDLTILASATRTFGFYGPVDSNITKVDDSTLLWTICRETYDPFPAPHQVLKLTVTPSGISWTTVTSNLQSLLGIDSQTSAYLYYSPTDGRGIAWAEDMDSQYGGNAGATVPVFTWSWNGTNIIAGTGPHTLTDGAYNFDSWSQFFEGQDGYLYFLPSAFETNPSGGGTLGSTTIQRLYRVAFSGDTPSLQQKFDLSPAALHQGERPPYGGPVYYTSWMLEVNDDGQVTWAGSLWSTDQALRHADGIDDPATTVTLSGYMTDPLYPLSNGIYTYRADGDAAGGIWGTYFANPNADDGTTNYVGVYRWGAAMALPDLDGELTEKRQKFARSPTDYTA